MKLVYRTEMYDTSAVKQRNVNEFLKALKKYARRNGVAVHVDYSAGRGSHGRLYYGARFTTIKARNKKLGVGLQVKMLKDLNIDPNDF
jgi:ribosomal protein L21E